MMFVTALCVLVCFLILFSVNVLMTERVYDLIDHEQLHLAVGRSIVGTGGSLT